MTLARTNLVAYAGGESAVPSYTTGSFTPPDNSLLVVVIAGLGNSVAANFALSGGGWTYTSRINISSGQGQAIVFTAPVTTGASMALTATNTGEDAIRGLIHAFAYTGYNSSSPVGATASKTTGARTGADSVTLSGSPASDSEVLAFDYYFPPISGETAEPATGWTEQYQTNSNTYSSLQTQTRTGSTSTTVGWDGTCTGLNDSAVDTFLAALEIKAAIANSNARLIGSNLNQSVLFGTLVN